MRKLEYVLRRIGMSVLVIIGLSMITFTLSRVVPSDPASLYVGPLPKPGDYERTREELGLNKPIWEQYSIYVQDMLQGNWGNSVATKRPVLQEIGNLWPASLELIMTAMTIAVLSGVVLGVLSAQLQGSPLDAAVRSFSIVGVSLPTYWLGLVLQILLFRSLHLLPLAGRLDVDLRFTHPIQDLTGFYLFDAAFTGNWVAWQDAVWHIILPAFTLASHPIGIVARMTRASMLEVLSQDHIRTARAFGISRRFIVYIYALKNAIGPTLTVIGLTLAYMLTGAFFVEVVFNWQGLGYFTVQSILNVDYPAVMGVTLLAALGYVTTNLIVDLLQAWIDPRISLA